jgi:hypothetical protein
MLVCVFYPYLHTRPRVQQAPGIPCALFFLGEMNSKARALSTPRDCRHTFFVIARLDRATQYPRGSND